MAEAIAELEKIVSDELGKSASSWADAPLRAEQVESELAGDLPSWYLQMRDEAWKTFMTTPKPSRRDEAWRFANLKLTKFSGLQLAQAVDDGQAQVLVERSLAGEKSTARLVFVNNALVSSEISDLPEGVICLPMNEALIKHGEKVREFFMQEEAQLGGKKFAALHGSGTLSGVFVHVPAGVELTGPVEVFHWMGGAERVILPHTLIVSGEGSAVSVIDHYQSIDEDAAALSIGMTDIVAGKNSKVNYVALQRLSGSDRQVQMGSTNVGQDAAVKTALINLGAAWVRNENISRMMASGARSDMLALNLAAANDELDQRTLQLHEVENTSSDLFYKNALYDQAKTIFDGLIVVEKGAHNTDAFQTCRNLLNSEDAEANSMPGLQIDADQVRCSHGSTAGPIDPEQLFYCSARGIPEQAARQLISFGFLHEVIDRLDGDEIKEVVNRELEKAFKLVSE